MFSQKDILKTQDMIDKRHLDIRTITMGISLLDCCDTDLDRCCEKIYKKITTCAADLVKVGCDIEKEFGIPIVNKRISVTPIALVGGSCETDSSGAFSVTGLCYRRISACNRKCCSSILCNIKY